MRVMKVAIIAEKKLQNPLTRVTCMYFFCNVATFHIPHKSPKKAFYCLNEMKIT